MTGKIDFSYRPETYFSESPNREQLLSKIKGKVRREEARARLETFGFSALNDFIARESLDEEERIDIVYCIVYSIRYEFWSIPAKSPRNPAPGRQALLGAPGCSQGGNSASLPEQD